MKNFRLAILQRFQALQCAGVEEISRVTAEKLLETLQEQETNVQISPAKAPDFGNVQSRVNVGRSDDSSRLPQPPTKTNASFAPKVTPSSDGQSGTPFKTSSRYGASESCGTSGNYRNSPYAATQETSLSRNSSASWSTNSSPDRLNLSRNPRTMAPKRLPLSLDVIVPPHEDYSSITQMEDRREALRLLGEKVAACVRCIELVSNRTQTVLGVGNPYAKLMFLGEAPGADEDRQGIPFVGRAGQLLTKMIENGMKINRDEETFICNILRCRPPGNRAPLPEEAFRCRAFLDAQIDIVKPEFICCLGASAAQYLLDTTTTISKMRLKEFSYRGARVVCTYHPAYLLRNPAQKAATWQDLQFLMKLMGLPLPDSNP